MQRPLPKAEEEFQTFSVEVNERPLLPPKGGVAARQSRKGRFSYFWLS